MKVIQSTTNNPQDLVILENQIFLFGAPLFAIGTARWDDVNKLFLSVDSKGNIIEGSGTSAWQNVKVSDGVNWILHIDEFGYSDEPMEDVYPPEYIPDGYGNLSAKEYVTQEIIDKDPNVITVDNFTP